MDGLIIFIKNLVRGKVKTRLARTMGEAKALEIYRRLLDRTRCVSQECKARRLLFYSDFIPEKDEWPEEQFEKFLQQGSGLGERMEQAFRVALSGSDRAVIIGSDCAGLTPTILEASFCRLDGHDIVIGPAFDGGYYLLGMKRQHPDLFRDISWSTPEVLSQTMARIRETGLSCFTLPALPDIDTEEDWINYGWG